MSVLYRRIFKTQTTGVATIQELMQTMFCNLARMSG